MTIIGKADQGLRAADSQSAKPDRHGAAAQRGQREMDAHSAFDFSEEALLSSDAFTSDGSDARQESSAEDNRHAQSRARGETPKKKSERVLATAGQAQAAQPVNLDPAAPVLSVAVSTDAPIAAIMERIEQAVRAGLHPGAGAPITLKIHLDDMKIAGLKSLSIAMTATTLDVTLAREPGDLSPELIAATQALADQLAARFPMRAVRVLDADHEADPSAESGDGLPGGMGAISHLFARTGNRR